MQCLSAVYHRDPQPTLAESWASSSSCMWKGVESAFPAALFFKAMNRLGYSFSESAHVKRPPPPPSVSWVGINWRPNYSYIGPNTPPLIMQYSEL